MKLFATVLSVMFVQQAALATTCTVDYLNKTNMDHGFAQLHDVQWATPTPFLLENGVSGRFMLETIMVNPDSGIETIVVDGVKQDLCKDEFLYKNNAEGQPIYAGVRTSCKVGLGQELNVSCWY